MNCNLYQIFSGPLPGIAPAIELGTTEEIFFSSFWWWLWSNPVDQDKMVMGLVSSIFFESAFFGGATTLAKSVLFPFAFAITYEFQKDTKWANKKGGTHFNQG